MINADLYTLILNGDAIASSVPNRGTNIRNNSLALKSQLLATHPQMDLVDEVLRQTTATHLVCLADAGQTLNTHSTERAEKMFDDLAVANAVRSINTALGGTDSCALVEQAAGIAGGAADYLLDSTDAALNSLSTAIEQYLSGNSSVATFIASLASLGAQIASTASDLLEEIDAELARLETMYLKHQALARTMLAEQLAQDGCAKAVLQRLGSSQLRALLQLA